MEEEVFPFSDQAQRNLPEVGSQDLREQTEIVPPRGTINGKLLTWMISKLLVESVSVIGKSALED